MGNDLEKQYNLKQKPIRLPGSYAFLKHVDHPTDYTASLIIIKSPHRAGIIASQILLPIRDIKTIGYSDYSVATCRKCKPLGLVKPRSEAEMKLIIKQIIKLGCEMGRIFICDGRLMIWCEQVRSLWFRSPQQIEHNTTTDKSKVFCAGICLINFLHNVYSKQTNKSRKDKKNPEIQCFFDPTTKKEYYQFVDNLEFRLSRSSFWSNVSEGMRSLVLVMLAKQQNDRIDIKTLMQLPYFMAENQLKLYHALCEQITQWQQKECIILMQTIEMVIHDRIIFDQLILNEYLSPVLVSLLEKRPQVVISAVVELPNPPSKQIVATLKKANPKNMRLFNAILMKIEKFHSALSQEQYDIVACRTAFCSFELEPLQGKLIRVIPFLIKTIKQPNYRKQIEFQLISQFVENKNVDKNILLLSLKCLIQIIKENLLTGINKITHLSFDPKKYQFQLQISIHILELYRLMILQVEPHQLMSVMMSKLEPFISSEELSDEIFLNSKRCFNLIMNRLTASRNLNEGDQFEIEYNKQFFKLAPIAKPPQSDVISVLKKQAAKSKNEHVLWLQQILERQQPLSEL